MSLFSTTITHHIFTNMLFIPTRKQHKAWLTCHTLPSVYYNDEAIPPLLCHNCHLFLPRCLCHIILLFCLRLHSCTELLHLTFYVYSNGKVIRKRENRKARDRGGFFCCFFNHYTSTILKKSVCITKCLNTTILLLILVIILPSALIP